MLLFPVNQSEIEKVFKYINAHKALGSYGFGVDFYQNYWLVIGQEVSLSTKSFIEHGKLISSLNYYLIVLIPNVMEPKHLNHLGQLVWTLDNAIYKIIAKSHKYILQRIISVF